MKYTNFIINENFIKVDKLISENKILKPITLLMAVFIACICVILCACAIPFTISIDGVRYTASNYYFYSRKLRKFKYYNSIYTFNKSILNDISILFNKRASIQPIKVGLNNLMYNKKFEYINNQIYDNSEYILNKGINAFSYLKRKLLTIL